MVELLTKNGHVDCWVKVRSEEAEAFSFILPYISLFSAYVSVRLLSPKPQITTLQRHIDPVKVFPLTTPRVLVRS